MTHGARGPGGSGAQARGSTRWLRGRGAGGSRPGGSGAFSIDNAIINTDNTNIHINIDTNTNGGC